MAYLLQNQLTEESAIEICYRTEREINLNLEPLNLVEVKMANEYDYNYNRGRYGKDYEDEAYHRAYDEPYYGSSGGYYIEPYNPRPGAGGQFNEPYGGYDYGRYEHSEGSREPRRRGPEG